MLLQIEGAIKLLVRTGEELTVIVKFCAVPEHPFAAGVTMTLAVSGDEILLAALKEAILPEPVAARPIDVLEFVQL